MSGSSCSHSTAARGQSTSLKRNSLCWGRHGFAQLAYGTLKLCCCCSRSPVLLQKQIVWQGDCKGHSQRNPFIISDLVSFSPCSEVLVQPWLKDFIHSFLSSYFPFPHCQHCQQLWGQACPCRHRFARSSAFSLTLPPSAVLRAELRPTLYSHLLHWEQIILWSSDLPEIFGHNDTKVFSLLRILT